MLSDILFALYGVPGELFVEKRKISHNPLTNTMHYESVSMLPFQTSAQSNETGSFIELSRDAASRFYPTEVHLLNKCAAIGSLFKILKMKCESFNAISIQSSHSSSSALIDRVKLKWATLVNAFIDENYVKLLSHFEQQKPFNLFNIQNSFDAFADVFELLIEKSIDFWLSLEDDAKSLLDRTAPFYEFIQTFRKSLLKERESALLDECFSIKTTSLISSTPECEIFRKCHFKLQAFLQMGGSECSIEQLKLSLFSQDQSLSISDEAVYLKIDEFCWRHAVDCGIISRLLKEISKFYFFMDSDFCAEFMNEISCGTESNVRISDIFKMNSIDHRKDSFQFEIETKEGFLRKSKVFDEAFFSLKPNTTSNLGVLMTSLLMNEFVLNSEIVERLFKIHQFLGRILFFYFSIKNDRFRFQESFDVHENVFQLAIYRQFVTGLVQYCFQDALAGAFSFQISPESKSDPKLFVNYPVSSFEAFKSRFESILTQIEEMLFLDAPSVQESLLNVLRWPKRKHASEFSAQEMPSKSPESMIALLLKGFYSISTAPHSSMEMVEGERGNSWCIFRLLNRMDLNEFYLKKS